MSIGAPDAKLKLRERGPARAAALRVAQLTRLRAVVGNVLFESSPSYWAACPKTGQSMTGMSPHRFGDAYHCGASCPAGVPSHVERSIRHTFRYGTRVLASHPSFLSTTIDTTENDRGALTVLDLAPDAIVIVELDGRVAYMNQAAGRLFQYDLDGVRGVSIESLMPDRVRIAHQHLRQEYTGSDIVPRPMGVGRPLTASRRDGSEFPAEISLSPVAWEGRRCVAAAVRDVSDRHEALQAIRTAHQSLATLVAASPVAIIACDSLGQVHEWNEAAIRLLGVQQTQAIGHRLNVVMDGWGEPLSALVTELASGAPISTDVALTVQRDAVTRLELRVSTARLGHEISAGFLLLIADDSPRRRARAENQLYYEISLAIRAAGSAHEALLVALTQIAEMFEWDCANAWQPDSSGTLIPTEVVYVGDGVVPAFKDWARTTALTPPSGSAGRAFLARGAVWVADMLDLGADPCVSIATQCSLRTSLSLPVVAGERVLAVLTFYSRTVRPRDERLERVITSVGAQLGASLDRRRAVEALAASEHRYRAIVSGTSIGIALLDAECAIQSANPALLRFLQREQLDDTGNLSWTELLAAESVEAMRSALCALSTGQAEHLTVTARFVCADNHAVWGRCNLAAVDGHSGTPGYTIVMVEDITMQLQVDEQLRHSELLLVESRKLEAVGRLADGIAHDFNNLLAVIRNTAEVLGHGGLGSSDVREHVDAILSSADRGSALTRQLLAYSRRHVLHPSVVDIAGLVNGMIPVLTRMTGPLITLDVSLSPPSGTVMADPTQLERVLANLVINARDATPNGGVVQIRCQTIDATDDAAIALPLTSDRYVSIEVQDHGVGMDATTRSRIFEPFFTTKGPGSGTGLGLATAHDIVVQCGGRIDVQSTLGEGTTFRILLPAIRTPAPH